MTGAEAMKILHTAYRVSDLAASLGFYSALGYAELGRVEIGEGATLTMLKFPDEEGPQGPQTSWLTDPDGYRIELVQWSHGHPDGITAADFA